MLLEMIAGRRALGREFIGIRILLFESFGHEVPTCRNQYSVLGAF